jgi:hypothetical protein
VGVGEAVSANCHTDSGVRPAVGTLRAATLPALGLDGRDVREGDLAPTAVPTGIAVIPTGDEDALAEAPSVWIDDSADEPAPAPRSAEPDPEVFCDPEPTRPLTWRPLQPAPAPASRAAWVREFVWSFGAAAAVAAAVAWAAHALV